MTYLKVKWIHSLADKPVFLYSELDKQRWEVRSVEIYQDGHCGYASSEESAGSTQLCKEPIPTISKIASDPQFEPKEIAREEFEEVWSRRKNVS